MTFAWSCLRCGRIVRARTMFGLNDLAVEHHKSCEAKRRAAELAAAADAAQGKLAL